MSTQIEKLIGERLKNLSPEVARAIKTVPWIEKLKTIVRDHKLSDERAEILFRETAIVVLGMESPQGYPENLFAELKLPDEVVMKIIRTVGEQIFTPLQEAIELKQIAKPEETLKSIPENHPETQEIAPNVIVEQSHAPANLIPPQPEEPRLEAPKLETSPSSLTPTNLPTGKPANIIEEKLSQVVSSSAKSTYPGGVDPYREPIN